MTESLSDPNADYRDSSSSIEDEEDNVLDHPEGAAAIPPPGDPPRDQSRLPKKGDIISFVLEDIWVTAKILNKAKSSTHYNVLLQDGAKLNIHLKPQDSWSLLPDEDWTPEQLRLSIVNDIRSREPSPMSDYERDHSQPTTPVMENPQILQLSLTPNESIQQGQVYLLPQTNSDSLYVQLSHHSKVYTIERSDYDKRYEKVVKEKKCIEQEVINFFIFNQLYEEEHSTSNKLKRLFIKKK